MEGHLSVSLLLNIGLLLLSATFLAACKPLQGILRPQSPSSPLQQLILAVLFGGMAILSTYFGMEVQGAIVNTRVISVTAAGLIGGPVAGIGAGLIGGLHRYFYSPGSFTALGCCVGTVCFGVVGSVAHAHQGRFSTSRPRLVLLTVTGELLQVGWLFLLARPISAVVALEKVIFLPKILLNSLGMVFFFEIFHRLDQTRVDEQIQYQSEALYIAQQCLPHLRQGLRPGEDLCRTADIIRRNSAGYQVIFTDRRQVLSSSGIALDSAALPEPSRACLASSQTQICRCKAPPPVPVTASRWPCAAVGISWER